MLRKLQRKDAPFMLEWMHDESVLQGLHRDTFINNTIEDCENFIEAAELDKNNIHYAIVDDTDQYQGTISLKNINTDAAELAIVLRACAQGKHMASAAIRELQRIAFRDMHLKRIYLYVKKDNIQAIHLYEKTGGVASEQENTAEQIADREDRLYYNFDLENIL